MENDYHVRGWSWGKCIMTGDEFVLEAEGKKMINIPFQQISNSNCPSKNEIAIEFHVDDANKEKGDYLCEMRLYVPTHNDTEEQTNAFKMQADLMQVANIGANSGEAIATFNDLNLIIPRGKYLLQFYQTFLRFHGQTHAHKILYKNIKRSFLLTKNDGAMALVLSLTMPIPQGNTKYYFIVIGIDKDDEETTKINIPAEILKQKYNDELQPMIKGFLFENISKLLKIVAQIKIVVQGAYKNKDGKSSIKCTIKQFDGHLFPLENGIIFINKPVMFLRHQDIECVEFSRAKGNTNRYFDIKISDNKGDVVQFSSIEKDEYPSLAKYIEEKKLKVRNVDEDVPISKNEEDNYEEEESDSDFKDREDNEKELLEDAKEEEMLEKE